LLTAESAIVIKNYFACQCLVLFFMANGAGRSDSFGSSNSSSHYFNTFNTNFNNDDPNS